MSNYKFLTICLNPTIQKTIVLDEFFENEINRSSEYYFDISGKGINVSRVLTQLNENVVHITQLGGSFKNFFLNLAKKEKFELVTVESNTEIRFCHTIVNKKNHTASEIIENGEKISQTVESNFFYEFLEHVDACDVVVISGAPAPGFSDEIMPKMVQTAKSKNKIVILDCRGVDLINSLNYSPDFIKPNYKEFAITFFPEESRFPSKQLLAVAKEKMLEINSYYKTEVILTNGMNDIFFTQNRQIHSLYPNSITPVNVVGSGDAFTAGFISNFMKLKSISSAIKFGEECARKNALLVRPGNII